MNSNELIKVFNKLIKSNRENLVRNSFIINYISKGKILYNSDQEYLKKILDIKPSENKIDFMENLKDAKDL